MVRLRIIVTLFLCLSMAAPHYTAAETPPALPLHVRQGLLGESPGDALTWLQEAAADGHAEAAFTLSKLYRLGELVPRDDERAQALLAQAALSGHTDARRLQRQLLPIHNAREQRDPLVLIRTRQPDSTLPADINWAQETNGLSLIVFAASAGRWLWVEYLATRLPPGMLESRDSAGNTALHHAAAANIEGAVHRLVEAGADLHARNHRGSTPLHAAVSAGAEQATNLLLNEGANPAFRDDDGWSAVMLAERYGSKALALLQTSASLEPKDAPQSNASEALLRSIKADDVSAINTALGQGADPNHAIDTGLTPLSLAIERASVDAVRRLLEAGAKLNHGPGTPAVLLAAEHHRDDLIELLIKAGGNVQASDADKRNALHMAALSGCDRCVETLITQEIDANQPDKNGHTPLLIAARDNRPGVLQALLEKQSLDPNLADRHQRTALWWAASNTNQAAVELLLAHGAMQSADDTGRTPLHMALAGSDPVLPALLMQQLTPQTLGGLSVNGSGLLHIAARYNNAAAITSLLNAGLDIHQENSNGDTALHIAAREGALEAATALLAAGASMARRNHQLVSPRTLMERNSAGAWRALADTPSSGLAVLWQRWRTTDASEPAQRE